MLRTISLLSLAVLVTLFSTLPVHAQWVQMNGPSGGYIRAITTSGSNFYAAVDSARHGGFGIFRSTNNGGSWSAKNNGLTNTYVWALAIIGTNLFAGTYGGGVFLSTDSGDTWTAANNGLSNTTVQALEVNGSNLFAGTLGGVFLSTNNGTSWDSVTNGDIVCLKAARTNLFAGTYGQGVLISSNNGMSWTEDTTGLTNNNVYALAVTGDTILAGTWGGGVFLSTNNGSNWVADTTGLGGSGVQGGLYIYTLAVSGNDLFVGTDEGGVYRSTNKGASWASVNSGLTNTFMTTFATSGNNLFAGTINGIFLSTNDGTIWTDASNGLPVNTNVQAFTVIGQDSPMLFAGEGSDFRGNYLGGFFISTDDGSNWQASSGLPANSDITALTVSTANSSFPVIFAGTAGFLTGLTGLIFRSSDSGTTWSRATNGLPPTLEVSALESIGGTDTSTPIVFAGTTGPFGGGGVLRSTDNGTTWKDADSGLTNEAITSFAVIGSNLSSPVVFLGTYGNGIFRSSDSGSIWIAGGNVGDMDVQALAVMGDGSSSSLLFASTYTGVYLSNDTGRSWTSAGLDTNRITTLVVSGSDLFAGDYNGGVYLSSDTGKSWKSEGLTNIEIQTLAVAGSNLFAGTFAEGIYRRPLSDFGLSSVASSSPLNTPLSAYPNPLTHSTTLNFTSLDGYATVTIVNQLGVEVARVFAGELPAGEHSFQWNVSAEIPPGMYECVVSMEESRQSIPIIVR